MHRRFFLIISLLTCHSERSEESFSQARFDKYHIMLLLISQSILKVDGLWECGMSSKQRDKK